jgi:hypothetical protein
MSAMKSLVGAGVMKQVLSDDDRTKGSDHENLRVGKVYKTQHAIDHGVTK